MNFITTPSLFVSFLTFTNALSMLSFKIGKKKDGAVPEDKELIKDLEAFKKLLKNGIERLEKGQLAEH